MNIKELRNFSLIKMFMKDIGVLV